MADVRVSGQTLHFIEHKWNEPGSNNMALDCLTGKIIPDTTAGTFTNEGWVYRLGGTSLEYFQEKWKLTEPPGPALGRRQLVFADDAGNKRWTLKLDFECVSALWEGERLFVSTARWNGPKPGKVFCFSKGSTERRWVFDLDSTLSPPDRKFGAPWISVAHGRVYVHCAGILYKLDADDGKLLGSFDFSRARFDGYNVWDAVQVIALENSVVLFHRELIVCLDDSLSNVKWKCPVNTRYNPRPGLYFHQGSVYFFDGELGEPVRPGM
jgi:outer membrane protein assembly factor BamB